MTSRGTAQPAQAFRRGLSYAPDHPILVPATAEPQGTPAIGPGGQFRFRFEKDPGFADSSTVLVVDDEGNRS